MYKNILVPATGYPGDEAVFQTALLVARQFASHIAFLHVKVDVTAIVVAMSAGDGMGGGSAIQTIVDKLEADAAQQEQKARVAVTRFCGGANVPMETPDSGVAPTAELDMETGEEAQWLAEHGRFADLIVVGRPRDGEGGAADVLETALMYTGKPVLIAAEAPPTTLLGTVVIAWKDTVEAARAVAAAMPLIDRAERVVILSVGEGNDAAASAERLRLALRRHVATTTSQVIPSDDKKPAVEVLLEAAKGLGATLLVMGGYSHSRLREVVFGGFTRHVLGAADIPVLMAH